MAFPTPGTSFPSDDWRLAFDQYDANDAWYSGDQVKLQRVYASAGNTQSRGDDPATHYNKADGTARRGGMKGFLSRMFNGTIVPVDEHRTRIHAPIAGNLATLSSDLLMAEPPTFRLMDESGQSFKGDAQTRLDKIMNGEDTHRTLSHAGELTAGISATVLTAQWDRTVSDAPWISATSADAAIPEFIAGRLAAVNLYTTYPSTAGGILEYVLIHVERHEPGAIVHGLLKATGEGKIEGFEDLRNCPATEHIPAIQGAQFGRPDLPLVVALPTGIRTLTAHWWRNLPTKTFRKFGQLAMLGRADFEGSEQLLDAADEVWSSWMRDIKIARARLIVPETFLDVQGPGMGGAFDTDREILTALAFTDLGPDQGKISAHQFEIRAEEHQATLTALTKEIAQHAGYSMSSYGEGDVGASKTATEVVDRTTLTERTRDKKFLYFAQAAHPLTRAMMELDAAHYGGKSIPVDATLDIRIAELSQIDPEKEARVYQYLRTAMAISTDTLVRDMHPEWDEIEVKREIDRIVLEYNIATVLDVDDAGAEGRVDPAAAIVPGVDDDDESGLDDAA